MCRDLVPFPRVLSALSRPLRRFPTFLGQTAQVVGTGAGGSLPAHLSVNPRKNRADTPQDKPQLALVPSGLVRTKLYLFNTLRSLDLCKGFFLLTGGSSPVYPFSPVATTARDG